MAKTGFYFDLDGTLVDSEKDLFAATQFALGDNICTAKPFNEVVALGSRAMLKQMMKEPLDEQQLDTAQHEFLSYYADNIHTYSTFYAGVEQLLIQLQSENIPHAIVTNKAYTLSKQLMQKLLPQWHGVIIGDAMAENYVAKPAPDRILKAIELTNNQEGENFYFGDYPTDIEAASRSGCFSVALGFGFHEANNPPERWGADFILETPQQMIDFIKQQQH